MPTYKGIIIKIQSGGVDVPEYMVEVDEKAKQVTCWIPSEAGKEFSIIADSVSGPRPEPWAVDVTADGTHAYGALFFDWVTAPRDIGLFRESQSGYRSLVFSKVELVDDDFLLQSSKESRVGEIQILCRSFKPLGISTSVCGPRTMGQNNKIHERAKKGITEHIGLGKFVEKQCAQYNVEYTETIVTFVFRYRPLYFLHAQGIAPAPKNSRAPAPEDVLDLTLFETPPKRRVAPSNIKVKQESVAHADGEVEDEEIKVLMTKIEELKARKRQRLQGNNLVKKEVKQEVDLDLTL